MLRSVLFFFCELLMYVFWLMGVILCMYRCLDFPNQFCKQNCIAPLSWAV